MINGHSHKSFKHGIETRRLYVGCMLTAWESANESRTKIHIPPRPPPPPPHTHICRKHTAQSESLKHSLMRHTKAYVRTHIHTHSLCLLWQRGSVSPLALPVHVVCCHGKKNLNKYRANRTNHSSHVLWHPFLWPNSQTHRYTWSIYRVNRPTYCPSYKVQIRSPADTKEQPIACTKVAGQLSNIASLLYCVARQLIILPTPCCCICDVCCGRPEK